MTKRTTQPPTPEAPAVTSFLPASIILMLLGWGGFLSPLYTSNRAVAHAGYFSLLLCWRLLGLRCQAWLTLIAASPSHPPATPGIVLRQAIWIGIYIPTLVWLQFGEVLNLFQAVMLGVGLFLIESLLRLRERAQWKPEKITKKKSQ